VTIGEPRPRYQLLADLLREEISAGVKYPAGSVFPTRAELQRDYGQGETTVVDALRILRGEGLIRTKQGARTTVRRVPVIDRNAANRFRIREQGNARGAFDAELAAMGLTPGTETEVSTGPAPDDVAAALGLAPGELVLIRSRRMYADGVPVQLAVSWLPHELVAGSRIEQVDTGPGGTYSRLAELGHGPAVFTETVSMRLPADAETSFLGLDSEQRAYLIRRTAMDSDGRVVEVIDTVMAADQFRLVYSWPA